MKEVTRTTVKEYNDEGKLIKETETVIEKEYEINSIPDYFKEATTCRRITEDVCNLFRN